MITSYRSDLNRDVRITNDQWGITMIIKDKKARNHVQIAIEGLLETGEKVKKIAHMRGPGSGEQECNDNVRRTEGIGHIGVHSQIGRVYIHDIMEGYRKKLEYDSEEKESRIKCRYRSDTFLIDPENVQNMLDNIQRECDHLENPRAFHIVGRNSVFAKNAITYKLTDPLIKLLFSMGKEKQIIDFYKFSQKHIEELQVHEEGELYYNPLGKSGVNKMDAYKDAYLHEPSTIKIKLAKFRTDLRKFKFKEVVLNLLVDIDMKLAFQGDQNEKNFRDQFKISDDDYQQLLGDIEYFRSKIDAHPIGCVRVLMHILNDGMEEITLPPDSCFTWARGHMEDAGAHFPRKKEERVAAWSKHHLQKCYHQNWHHKSDTEVSSSDYQPFDSSADGLDSENSD